jgi:hypothetical protein
MQPLSAGMEDMVLLKKVQSLANSNCHISFKTV